MSAGKIALALTLVPLAGLGAAKAFCGGHPLSLLVLSLFLS